MPHGGISYGGWKERADGLRLYDAQLTKILREAVQKRSIISQFTVEKNKFGEGKGDESEIVLAADDPSVNMTDRCLQSEMDKLKTTSLSFAAHSYRSREYGLAIKYNKGDVSLAEFNLEGYVRDFLARDVARVRDLMAEHELNLTPYRYIPYNEREGAVLDAKSYFRLPDITAHGGVIPDPNPGQLIAASHGKIIPVQWPYYNGNYQLMAAGDILPGRGSLAQPFIPNPLFIGVLGTDGVNDITAIGPRYTVAGGKAPVPLNSLDPSLPPGTMLNPAVYPVPKLNLMHLRNMVAMANRLGLLPYDELNHQGSLKQGYVLIAPSIQINNLIDSINWLAQNGNMGGIAPSSVEELKNIPSISGASFMVPGLATPVLAVVDDYSLLNMHDIYNLTWDGVNAPGTNRNRLSWATQVRTLWSAVLNVHNVGVANADINSFAATDMIDREAAHDNGTVFTAHHYAPEGYGPAYLLGRNCVEELVNIPWAIKKMEDEDLGRLTGFGYHMWNAMKNYFVPQNNQVTKGMPFAAAGHAVNVQSQIAASVLQYYNRNKVIKMDTFSWIEV